MKRVLHLDATPTTLYNKASRHISRDHYDTGGVLVGGFDGAHGGTVALGDVPKGLTRGFVANGNAGIRVRFFIFARQSDTAYRTLARPCGDGCAERYLKI